MVEVEGNPNSCGGQGLPGGSGGGGEVVINDSGGTGNTPPVSPAQGTTWWKAMPSPGSSRSSQDPVVEALGAGQLQLGVTTPGANPSWRW